MDLSDSEIKKALECCMDEMGCKKGCPCFNPKAKGSHCTVSKKLELEKLTLDLINRLQADIKKLTSGKCIYLSDDETTEYCVEGPCPNYKTEAQIKAEAYKEFFNLVHSEFKTISDYQYGKLNMTFCLNFQVAIDKLREIYRKLEGGTSV